MDISSYKQIIEQTFLYLNEGNFEDAKAFFNINVSKLDNIEFIDKKYLQIKLFLEEFDDYLNDPVVKIIHSTNLEELKRSYKEIMPIFSK